MKNKDKFDEAVNNFIDKTVAKAEIDKFLEKKDVGTEDRIDLVFVKSDGKKLEYHCIYESGNFTCRCTKGEEPE